MENLVGQTILNRYRVDGIPQHRERSMNVFSTTGELFAKNS